MYFKKKLKKTYKKKVFTFLLSILMLLSFTTPSFAATSDVDTGDEEIITFYDTPIDTDIQQEDELQLVTELDKESTKSLSGIIPDIDVKQNEKKQVVAIKDNKAATYPTYQEAYDRMTALQSKYPEGMKFTNHTPYGNGTEYRWHGGPIGGVNIVAVGCAAFAFELSDAAFGNLPNRALIKFSYEDVKVGDILRVNGNSHVVIVLQVTSGGLIIAEANYNGTVHWGRAMSISEVERANMLITRYPVGYSEEKNADEETANGNEGNLKWSLTNGGVLTISGTGAISNYTTSNLPSWSAHKDKINTVVIKDGINNIGDYAFYGLSNLLSVYIPNGVKTIGSGAFQNTKLVSVTIPSTVTSIGNNAFYNCTSLVSASVFEGLETIGNYAFRACTSLQYIDFPAAEQ